ncbi:MAG: hypothetical protein O3A46_14350 [Candidatus Poribacteria bacterium]|nr:hypothetical protein [Candidatus Poribacteria bacterium]
MFSRSRRTQPRRSAIAWIGVLALATTTAFADYYYGGIYDYEYTYAPERLSREHRNGAEMDDWLERGNATVTLSPAFDDGIRVAAWATDYNTPDDEFDFGIASAIYLFDVPYRARQIMIRVRYEGNGVAREFGSDEPIAGRVWVRSEHTEGREDAPLQGDTFVLRANERSETIRIPAARYVNSRGQIEVHVVADGQNRIDVQYLEVESFSREEEVRVVRRHIPSYTWAPWRSYTYHVFYGGSFYYPTDYGYYLYWDFPYSSATFVSVRRNYYGYLTGYRYRYPHRAVYVNHCYYPTYRTQTVRRVSRWSPSLSAVRDEYERGRTSGKLRTAPKEAQAASRNVSAAIENYRTSPELSSVTTKQRRAATEATPLYQTSASRYQESVDGSKLRRAPSTSTYNRSTPTYDRTYESSSPSRTYDSDASKARRAPTYDNSRSSSSGSSGSRVYNRSDDEPKSSSSSSSTKSSRTSSGSSSSSTKSAPASSSSSSSSNDEDDENTKKRRAR